MFEEADLRVKDRGFEGDLMGGGAVPTSAKEKDEGGLVDVALVVPFERVLLGLVVDGFEFSLTDVACLFGVPMLALTINCSPSSLIPIPDKLLVES